VLFKGKQNNLPKKAKYEHFDSELGHFPRPAQKNILPRRCCAEFSHSLHDLRTECRRIGPALQRGSARETAMTLSLLTRKRPGTLAGPRAGSGQIPQHWAEPIS